MRKKVYLCAYDRQNLGDDLFVQAVVRRYPGIQFYMWSDQTNQQNFRFLSNLKVYVSKSRLQLLLEKISPTLGAKRKSAIEDKCDAMVYVGGSIFIEYENWETILTWWDFESSHRNMFVLGANFGPYHTEAYRERMGKILSEMKDVCFRDNYSEKLFDRLPNVRVAPDILFGMNMPVRDCHEKRLFVSIIDCASEDHPLKAYETSYYHSLYHLLREAYETGYTIVLSSFCKAEGDERAITALENMFPDILEMKVDHCFYTGSNSEDILREISNSDYVIATRFHASILAFAAEKPVLPVVYSDKTVHVLEDAGFQGSYLDIRDMKVISFSEFVCNRERQKLTNIGELRKKSNEHFKVLDDFLKD